jgi:hypothetical protein
MEHMKLYISLDISVRYNRTMIYIASSAPFDISVRYTRTVIYIASYAPFDISVRYTGYKMEHMKLYIYHCPGVPN